MHTLFFTERYFAGLVSGTLTYVSGPLNLKGAEEPVEVDSGAYYAEHAYPGSYLLKLSYGDSLECRITLVVPKQGTRLDISAKQAQQCLGFPYHSPETGERISSRYLRHRHQVPSSHSLQ